MTLSDDDRAQIRARAESAATLEPEWVSLIERLRTVGANLVHRLHPYDLSYLRRVDPATTLALLDERDNLAAEVERLRVREQHAIEYERRINWNTTCGGCADRLDGEYADTMRAEIAEARIAAVEALADSDSLDACECGHGLDEHNGLGCYARLSYNPTVTCLCNLTDDRLHGDLVRLNIRAVLRGETR